MMQNQVVLPGRVAGEASKDARAPRPRLILTWSLDPATGKLLVGRWVVDGTGDIQIALKAAA